MSEDLNRMTAFGLVFKYSSSHCTRFSVHSIGFDCSGAIADRACKIVKSIARAYYRKLPSTCWTNFFILVIKRW